MSEKSYVQAYVRCQRDLICKLMLDVIEMLFRSLCQMSERSYLQAYVRCQRDLIHKLMLDVREILSTSLF